MRLVLSTLSIMYLLFNRLLFMANVCRVFIIIRRLETIAGIRTVTVTAATA